MNERWRNVAQAAQWLAEGREVEVQTSERNGRWFAVDQYHDELSRHFRYRLKSEPPKPREWVLIPEGNGNLLVAIPAGAIITAGIRVREVIE